MITMSDRFSLLFKFDIISFILLIILTPVLVWLGIIVAFLLANPSKSLFESPKSVACSSNPLKNVGI